MRKASFLAINVPNPHRSSQRKSGQMRDYLAHGQKVVMAANFLYPDVDEPMFEEFLRFIAQYKPDRIYFLGRMVHDLAFQLLAPGAVREAELEDSEPCGLTDGTTKNLPEFPRQIFQAKEGSKVWEDRVNALGKIIGKELLVRTVETAGPQCHLFYIPALEGTHQNLPPESNIGDVLKAIQARVNYTRLKNGETEDVPAIPMERKDFARLLGVHEHPRIHVRPFGSSITVGCLPGDIRPDDTQEILESKVFSRMRVEVGRRKVKNPIGEAFETARLNLISVVQGYAPQLSNGWFTKLTSQSIERIYLSFHQIGMLFARERMDFGDSSTERYATGFFVGYNCRGTMHGKSFPFLRGADGRRSVVIYSHPYSESSPGGLGRTDVFMPPASAKDE